MSTELVVCIAATAGLVGLVAGMLYAQRPRATRSGVCIYCLVHGRICRPRS